MTESCSTCLNCELGHHGEDVSFNSILKKYKLTDPALVLLGEIVRAADSHPANPHPAGEGLRWIAGGFGALGLSDHEILEREFIVYDALYAECKRRVSQRFSRRSKLADFFGLKRNLVILLIAIFVIGAGEELWMRFVPKYLQAVGATVFVIGLYDALRTLLGAIYAYPGGVLADRWGHRHAFIIFNVVSIIGYALVLLIPNWGGSHRRNVFLPFMELFFPAGNVFARRRCTRSKSPLHGHRRSISDQTIADHDCANFRRNVDRSLRNHPRRAHRAYRLDLSLRTHNSGATAIARRTRMRTRESPREQRRSQSTGIFGEACASSIADAAFALKRHPDSFLRTSSLCVGGDFCDGLHRRERSSKWAFSPQ